MPQVDADNADALAQNGLYKQVDILTGKVKIRHIGGSLGDIRGLTYAEEQ